MAYPDVVSRAEWLEARQQLLQLEKQATRERDALNSRRRRLPMVSVQNDYRFATPHGEVGLAELFGGRRQLIVQHVMYDPSWEKACSGCTASVDEIATGMIDHLNARDTSFVLVSRAPLEKLSAWATARGWTVPWYSSGESDFNYDFQATVDRNRPPLVYNYREEPDILGDGDTGEMPGLSCFLRDDDGQIFHTYSTWARGTDALGGSYTFLDLTALGRQEEWEEPRDRAPAAHRADPSFSD